MNTCLDIFKTLCACVCVFAQKLMRKGSAVLPGRCVLGEEGLCGRGATLAVEFASLCQRELNHVSKFLADVFQSGSPEELHNIQEERQSRYSRCCCSIPSLSWLLRAQVWHCFSIHLAEYLCSCWQNPQCFQKCSHQNGCKQQPNLPPGFSQKVKLHCGICVDVTFS